MHSSQYATSPLRKAWAANADTTSFASRIPTIVEPVNDGVITLAGAPGSSEIVFSNELLILPYGLGANNDAFSMRVIGWRHIGQRGPQAIPLWVPTVLAEFACIMGAAVGVALAPVLNTEAFADTITIVSQPSTTGADAAAGVTKGGNIVVYSPANDTAAWIRMPIVGVEKVEFTFDQTTNTPTCNALVALFTG